MLVCLLNRRLKNLNPFSFSLPPPPKLGPLHAGYDRTRYRRTRFDSIPEEVPEEDCEDDYDEDVSRHGTGNWCEHAYLY